MPKFSFLMSSFTVGAKSNSGWGEEILYQIALKVPSTLCTGLMHTSCTHHTIVYISSNHKFAVNRGNGISLC